MENLFTSGKVKAALEWIWNYSGANTSAHGTFLTSLTKNSSGLYQISKITGEINGDPITGLYPAGEAIPGNQGYPVDDLISPKYPQLTSNGFGFSTSEGNFANPFFASYLQPPLYLEVLTSKSGISSEIPISFSAVPVAVLPGMGNGGDITGSSLSPNSFMGQSAAPLG